MTCDNGILIEGTVNYDDNCKYCPVFKCKNLEICPSENGIGYPAEGKACLVGGICRVRCTDYSCIIPDVCDFMERCLNQNDIDQDTVFTVDEDLCSIEGCPCDGCPCDNTIDCDVWCNGCPCQYECVTNGTITGTIEGTLDENGDCIGKCSKASQMKTITPILFICAAFILYK